MASQVASKDKLLQFYLFGIASQEAVFEALLEAMPKGPFTSAVAIEMYIIFQHQQLMISHKKK